MKKKLIIFFLFFNIYSYAGIVPYCAHENTSSFETIKFSEFLNKETQQVMNELDKVLQKQYALSETLSQKAKTLNKIKKVLGQILIMKKRQNFLLKKQIDLNQY